MSAWGGARKTTARLRRSSAAGSLQQPRPGSPIPRPGNRLAAKGSLPRPPQVFGCLCRLRQHTNRAQGRDERVGPQRSDVQTCWPGLHLSLSLRREKRRTYLAITTWASSPGATTPWGTIWAAWVWNCPCLWPPGPSKPGRRLPATPQPCQCANKFPKHRRGEVAPYFAPETITHMHQERFRWLYDCRCRPRQRHGGRR